MNWTLMVLPSGDEVKVSVRIVRPLEGAISSLSIAASMARCASARAFASGVETSAIIWSRFLASGVGGMSGKAPITALIRGSILGSAISLDAIGARLLGVGPPHRGAARRTVKRGDERQCGGL